MTQPEKKWISPEAYFEMEETAAYKNEYHHGEIFAMTGASHCHNLIAMNVAAELHTRLREKDCFVYSSDMKIELDPAHHYVYPDVTIVCGEVRFAQGRDDVVTNPIVLMEILSESTKDYDRGSKFAAYRKLPSLKEYVLIDQYSRHVEHFQRTDDNRWVLADLDRPDDVLILPSVGVDLPLSRIYDRVDLPDESP